MRPRSFIATSLLLVVAGCVSRPPPFPDFARADRVVVLGNLGMDTLAVLSDPRRVAGLTAFADARNNRWEQPWYGIPVSRVDAVFYAGDELLGSFGAGINTFRTQREGTFATRRARDADVREFARLTGVSVTAIRGE